MIITRVKGNGKRYSYTTYKGCWKTNILSLVACRSRDTLLWCKWKYARFSWGFASLQQQGTAELTAEWDNLSSLLSKFKVYSLQVARVTLMKTLAMNDLSPFRCCDVTFSPPSFVCRINRRWFIVLWEKIENRKSKKFKFPHNTFRKTLSLPIIEDLLLKKFK